MASWFYVGCFLGDTLAPKTTTPITPVDPRCFQKTPPICAEIDGVDQICGKKMDGHGIWVNLFVVYIGVFFFLPLSCHIFPVFVIYASCAISKPL